jgi:preprotein translocase subunit SecA
MDTLRASINMRAYGQKDPKLEYQREGFALFEEMNARIDQQTLEHVFKFALPPPPDAARTPAPTPLRTAPPPEASPPAVRPAPRSAGPVMGAGASAVAPGKIGKVGRNDPCPCGSGKKYKRCHGAS